MEPQVPSKKHPFRLFCRFILILLGVVLVGVMALVVYALVNGTRPEKVMREDFTAYASLPSASQFVKEVLHLKALDTILADPSMGDLRGTIRSLRANPFLRSPVFNRVANIRLDAAVYGKDGWILVADLGVRAAILPPALFAARHFPAFLGNIDGLSISGTKETPFFEYHSQDQVLYIGFFKDLCLVTPKEDLLIQGMKPKKDTISSELSAALRLPNEASLRFLANSESLASSLPDGLAARFASSLEFSTNAVVDLDLKDETLKLSIRTPISSGDEGLGSLLAEKSRTPSILSRFPASTSYYSLLSAATPGELWAALSPYLDKDINASYDSADSWAQRIFGMGIQEMLFSWMGDELGVFATKNGPAPIFFVSIADERNRKKAFENIFDSFAVKNDQSAVVGDLRVPRLAFPSYLRGFLNAIGVQLVEPFYLIYDDVLYASSSAEILASAIQELRAKELLVKNENWKNVMGGVSAESSASLFYSLDRSVPFFLRSDSSLSRALKLYRQGLASIRLNKGELQIQLAAIATGEAPVQTELAGFPIKTPSRIDSELFVARDESKHPKAFWTSGKAIYTADLSSGKINVMETDDSVYLALEKDGDRLVSVWAVSRRGTVYRTDASLNASDGFPIVSGEDVSSSPAAFDGKLYVPISSGPALLRVDAAGTTVFTEPFHARLKSRPEVSSRGIAFLPRSFDSLLYFTDGDGKTRDGWPVTLSGIASAAPLLFEPKNGIEGAYIASLTESGDLSLFDEAGQGIVGFPVSLEGVFDAKPAWAPGVRSFFAISGEGILWRIGLDGAILGSAPVKRGAAKGSSCTAFDMNGDGREEVIVSGGGDALYAYSSDLNPLNGFPLSGSTAPGFIDIDGNGRAELVVAGADDTIHAYNLP